MYHIPDPAEVAQIASTMGIHLGADEVALYQRHLADQLRAVDDFVQSRLEEAAPPLVSPAREPGHRPDATEDPLNAWTWRCHIEGLPGGLLAGKTVSYKDHVAVAGIPTTYGAFPLDGFRPDFDATVVTKVLEAGGTVVGKNVMNGLTGGYSFGGGIGDYGRTLNPHRHDHVAGGSSCGSGAAVAAGEVDISFGGDQGGSIRVPAALSGTIGLKPTFGLISHFGIGFGSDQSIDFTGPMTRTVEDCAAALQATAGYDGYDPRQGRDVPVALDATSQLADGIAGLRIGVLEEGFREVEPDVDDGVRAAVDVLAANGAKVTKISVPEMLTVADAQMALSAEGSKAVFDTGFFGSFTKTYYPASVIAAVNTFWETQTDLLNPRTKLGLIAGQLIRTTYRGRVYAKAQNVRPMFVRAFDRALADVDVLVMPTCPFTAPRYVAPSSYLDAVEQNFNLLASGVARNTMPFNFTGHPALAVPVGKSGGLPVSMQLVGRFFDDALLLRVAHAFQSASDWDAIIAVDGA